MKTSNELSQVASLIRELASETTKVWMVETATLKNVHGTFDISGLDNVHQMEFVFHRKPPAIGEPTSQNIHLVFRPGYGFNWHVRSKDDIETEQYMDVQKSKVLILDAKHKKMNAFHDALRLQVWSAERMAAVWDLGDNRMLYLRLRPKDKEDYVNVPKKPLVFEEAFVLESSGVEGYAPDLWGSRLEHCLYFATKEDWGEEGNQKFGMEGVLLERITRIDLNTGQKKECCSPGNFYATKRMVPVDRTLMVVGAYGINSYDLKLDTAPTTVVDYREALHHQFKGLSRFGAAGCGGKIYVVGGAMYSDLHQMGKERIYVYDFHKDTMEIFAELPHPLFGAGAEIVHDKLYVFGGSEHLDTSNAYNTLWVFDLATGEHRTEKMPFAMPVVHVSRKENLIFVAGNTLPTSQQGKEVQGCPFIGVYNVKNRKFTTLETNLPMVTGENIHAMTVVGEQVYVLFGKRTVDHYRLQEWDILKAHLPH